MDHIIKDIYISGSSVLKRQDDVYTIGIRAVLRVDNLDRNVSQWDERFILKDMPFQDGEPVLRDTFQESNAFIDEQVQARRPILVHCHMGVSRSVTLVLAYLIEKHNMSLGQAFATVKSGRRMAYPHDQLVKSLVDYYKLPHTVQDIESAFFLDSLAADYRRSQQEGSDHLSHY